MVIWSACYSNREFKYFTDINEKNSLRKYVLILVWMQSTYKEHSYRITEKNEDKMHAKNSASNKKIN